MSSTEQLLPVSNKLSSGNDSVIETVPPDAQSVVVSTLPPLLDEPPVLLPEEDSVVVESAEGEVLLLLQPIKKNVGARMVMPAADFTSIRRR